MRLFGRKKILMTKATRDTNIELLRLVLMFLIVLMHVFLFQLAFLNTPSAYIINSSIACFSVMAVNCYVFISGYFGIKVSLKSFLAFVLQVLFYSVVFCGISLFFYYPDISLRSIINAFFPLFAGQWWFATIYIVLYILSPFLNLSIDNLERRQVLIILIGLFAFDCVAEILFGNSTLSVSGYGIFHFIALYCLSRYFRKYDIRIKFPILWYIIPVLILIISIFIGYYYFEAKIHWSLFVYNNPLVIISAIGFFYTFKSINIKSKFINKIALLSFGVYLIHTHPFVFDKCVKPIVFYISGFSGMLLKILALVLFSAIIFVVCILIDKLRQLICTPLVNKINKNFEI